MPGATDPAVALQSRLSQILSGSDFPALSRQIIETISVLNDDASSLQRLANVVLREYSLTLGVVRTANSAHYRRSGRTIQSATHAMMMLGARTVRHLASSLLLFENYARRSEGLKELMLLSLLTANHARETAKRLEMADPEEAHLCGMFRNLGEVLVAFHLPKEYAAIQSAMRERRITDSGAANATLGFRYEDLGVEIAKHWGMPDTVLTAMRARHASQLSPLGSVTSFSHDLTRAIYREPVNGKDSQQALEEVIAEYAPRLKLTRAMVLEIVSASLEETRELFSQASGDQGKTLRELSAAARKAMGERELSTGEWATVQTQSQEDAAGLNQQVAFRERLQHELENRVMAYRENSMDGVSLLALEAALRGGPCDRAVLCVLNDERTQLVGRSALGSESEEWLERFRFPISARGGPLVAALLKRQSVILLPDRVPTDDEKRWIATAGCGAFGVYPIIAETRVMGCLYVDRLEGSDGFDEEAHVYLQGVAMQVARAFVVRRA
ncbi:MAG: HDOD domain-containing protein [Gemmatimonas sp.]